MQPQYTTKVCKRCHESKPLSEYYHLAKRQGNGYKGICKSCYVSQGSQRRSERQRATLSRTCRRCQALKPLYEFDLGKQICRACHATPKAKHVGPPCVPSEKLCKRCLVTKPISEFHKASKRSDGHQEWCKPCANSYTVDWHKQHPVMTAKARLRHYESGRQQDHVLHKKYGLPHGQYEYLLALQGGGCAICGKGPDKHRLHVDHDHRTGVVRGLLCYSCNYAIGLLGDDTTRFAKALAYMLRVVGPSNNDPTVCLDYRPALVPVNAEL